MIEPIRLKKLVKLFLLTLAVWIGITLLLLSDTFADNTVGQVEGYITAINEQEFDLEEASDFNTENFAHDDKLYEADQIDLDGELYEGGATGLENDSLSEEETKLEGNGFEDEESIVIEELSAGCHAIAGTWENLRTEIGNVPINGTRAICLTANISNDNGADSALLEISGSRNITIMSNPADSATFNITQNAVLHSPPQQGVITPSRRHFTVSDGSLTLVNVRLDRNLSSENPDRQGGGVHIGGNGTLVMGDGSLITGARFRQGGGVYVESGGQFTMNNGARVEDNLAIEFTVPLASDGETHHIPTDARLQGGGVYVRSGATFTMNGGSIARNHVSLLNGVGGVLAHSRGGGVSLDADAKFYMHGGTIERNTARAGGGVMVGAGHFEMDGGSIRYNRAESEEVVNIRNLTADEGSHIPNGGGGVALGYEGGGGAGGTFIMETSGGSTEIRNNTSLGSQGGGGVLVREGSTFTMNGGVITGNETATHGGGLAIYNGNFTMGSDAEISHHNIGGWGGAIFAQARTVAELPTSNIVLNINGRINDNTASIGGGIATEGNTTLPTGASLDITINGGILEGNKAISGSLGGGIGGAIAIGTNGRLTIENDSLLDNNRATTTGGAIWTNWHMTVNIKDTYITNNTAGTTGGGARLQGLIELENVKISGNRAGSGAGLIIDAGIATLENVDIGPNNEATIGSGGGLYAGSLIGIPLQEHLRPGTTAQERAPRIYINGGKVMGNKAAINGGGVQVEAISVIIDGAKIYNNLATGSGGGVNTQLASSVLTLTTGSIYENDAVNGGGVNMVNGTFNMNGGVVNENEVTDSGGGVKLNAGTFNLSANGFIDSNTATNGGGVYVSESASLIATGGTITNNTATADGGGIFTGDKHYVNIMTPVSYKNLSIADAYFNGNQASSKFAPPFNLGVLDITATNASVFHHPLNNYDINFRVDLESFSFTKMDQFDLETNFDAANELDDAYFALYIEVNDPDDGDFWQLIEIVRSGENGSTGLVEFEDTAVALDRRHKLVEVSAPKDFVTPTGHWYITFDSEAEEMIFDGSHPEMPRFVTNADGQHYVGNQAATVEFEFIKTTDNGTPLPHAVFDLYRRDVTGTGWDLANPVAANVRSGSDGLVEFEGLTLGGEYRLIESKAPEEFDTPDGYWKITIEPDRISIETKQGSATNAVVTPDFIRQPDGSYHLPNHRTFIPPMGLTDNGHLYVNFAVAATLVGLSIVYYKRRKYEDI